MKELKKLSLKEEVDREAQDIEKEVARTGSHIKAISAIAQRNMKNT